MRKIIIFYFIYMPFISSYNGAMQILSEIGNGRKYNLAFQRSIINEKRCKKWSKKHPFPFLEKL